MRGGGGRAGISRFKGVSWNKTHSKLLARCKRTHLGLHTTEEAAARAYNKYLMDGMDPRPPSSSQFLGVSWNKKSNKWAAVCKGTQLGYYATEEDAACAYIKYLEDGMDPLKHREAVTSKFTGVNWYKKGNKWQATCKGRHLGYHTQEEGAALAYNVEAEHVGRPLNVIPPAGAAGTGAGRSACGGADLKRAAPKTPAALATSKKTKRAAPTTQAAPASGKKMKL